MGRTRVWLPETLIAMSGQLSAKIHSKKVEGPPLVPEQQELIAKCTQSRPSNKEVSVLSKDLPIREAEGRQPHANKSTGVSSKPPQEKDATET
jgi:hypothetical protein